MFGHRLWIVPFVVAAACGPRAELGFRSGSSALSVSGDDVFVADADNGTLTRVSTGSGDLEAFVLGLEPTRVTRVGDDLWVTLRAAGEVAIVHDDGENLSLVDRIQVGAEPYGIVASPDGDFVYVALSTADRVVEIDTSSREVVRKFTIPGQPRWLAMHPSGGGVYVGCPYARQVFRIRLGDGEVTPVDLPPIQRGDPSTGEVHDLVPRITGDLTVSGHGDILAIPALYVDNTSSVGGADPLEDDGTVSEENPSGGDGYAAGDPEGLTRFNPAIVTFDLEGEGLVRLSSAASSLVAGKVARDADEDVVPNTGGSSDDIAQADTGGRGGSFGDDGDKGENRVRGYLTSLVFSSDDDTILGTVEGGAAVIVMPARPVTSGRPEQDEKDPFFGDGGFQSTTRVFIGTELGTSALAVAPDGSVWAWNFLARSLSRFEESRSTQLVKDSITAGSFRVNTTVFAGAALSLDPSILPPDVVEGRELFYSSSNPSMAAAGAGVSCATCHFDGRNDGLTWTFDHGVRQTPSLAGRVSDTAPVTWTSEVDSVKREAFLTSQGRMGGSGIRDAQTESIAAYIDWSRSVVMPEQDADAVARGRSVFLSAEAGCGTCHSGERLTDNRSHAMMGEVVNTPTLTGVGASGPYLHDGSARDLTELIDRCDEIGMGKTSHLSAGERLDLEVYLKSL